MVKRGWSKVEKDALLACAKNAFEKDIPLKNAFADFAKKYGRKRDSVRNFYYLIVADSALRGENLVGIKKNDIEIFEKKELDKLVRKIMDKLKEGSSLRGAIASMTKDKQTALRYQNKFRNLVKAKSEIINKIMLEQKVNGRYYDPYRKIVVAIEPEIKVLHKDVTNELLNSITEKIDNLNSDITKTQKKKLHATKLA